MKTIKERITALAKKYNIKSELFESEVIDIVERGSFHDNFCEKCDSRMVFDKNTGKMYCINCGNTPEPKVVVAPAIKSNGAKPSKGMADKILALKARMDGVEAPPTAKQAGDSTLGPNVNWS